LGQAAPILASERTAARLLDMKPAEFRRLVDLGVLPQPHVLGGLERWRVAELDPIRSGRGIDDEFET
jgi:hypothetical protein